MKVKIVATIVKIGNSQGIRLSKHDLAKIGAEIGDNIDISEVKKVKHKPDLQKAIAALKSISEMNGTLSKIDVDKWMEERRQCQAERDKRLNDLRRR